MWESPREYIPVAVHWDKEGELDYNDNIIPFLTPLGLFLEGGGRYGVDRVCRDGMLPSATSGGYGIRYRLRTSCEDENAFNKCYFLYFEDYEELGRWRCGDEYVAADVLWDSEGRIRPCRIYIHGHCYIIPKKGIIQSYPMATRKSDGSGMRFLVQASCRELGDYRREFSLMLENGGLVVGRWFLEDCDQIYGRRVLFSELDDGAFDMDAVYESIGVTQVCAGYRATEDMVSYLREWNGRESGGLWLPPEEFERRAREPVIRPEDWAPVMVAGDSGVVGDVMRWGFRRPWVKHRGIYNLGCGALVKKATFNDIKGNRCVIPAAGFFGQDNGENLLEPATGGSLYMAGLYDSRGESRSYSILTTEAGGRMPVALRRGVVSAWLSGRLDLSDVEGGGRVSFRRAVV